MKETPEQSAELKHAFKNHFRRHGFNSSLPESLESERMRFPVEWAEAREEWEREKAL